MPAQHDHEAHRHGPVHLDEGDWAAWAAHTELEGEVLRGFVAKAAAWVAELRGPDAPAVRRIIDIGCGPGVGSCELARLFPDAHVTAVDISPAMLERATRRAAAHGLQSRVSTRTAELPDGLDGLVPADLIWASMSLHHVDDELTLLRVLRDLLAPGGLLAIAEIAEPMRVLPDELDVGQPGLFDRLEEATSSWFAAMRDGLTHSVATSDLPSMLATAHLEVVRSRLVDERLDPPLSNDARLLAQGYLERTRRQLEDRLDADDLETLAVLSDADDPRGVMHRPDVFVGASRQILIARPSGGAR